MKYKICISEYNEETQIHSTGYKDKSMALEIAHYMNSKAYGKTYWVIEQHSDITLCPMMLKCIEDIRRINQNPDDKRLLKQELKKYYDADYIKIAKMLIKKDVLR